MKILRIIKCVTVAILGGPVAIALVVCLALLGLILMLLPGGLEIIEIESDRAAKKFSKWSPMIRTWVHEYFEIVQ